MDYFNKMEVSAARSVQLTSKIRLHVSSLLLKANSLLFEINVSERRDSIQEAREYLNNTPMSEVNFLL